MLVFIYKSNNKRMAMVIDEFINVGGGCCNPAFFEIYTLNNINDEYFMSNIFSGDCAEHAYILDSNLVIKLPPGTRAIILKFQIFDLDLSFSDITINIAIQGTTGSLCADKIIFTPNENNEITIREKFITSIIYIGFIL